MNQPTAAGLLPGASHFWTTLDASLAEGSFLGASLSKRRADAGEHPDKLTIRSTVVKGAAAYQWTSRHGSRETHENLSPAETARRLRELLPACYAHAHVFTTGADFEIRAGGAGELRIRKGPPTKTAAAQTHNRPKAYLIPENAPCPFLAEIGVMTPAGKVRASKYGKFRQINRFLELVRDVADDLPQTGQLRIVDFGCGKSYLTFALHHLLTQILNRDVDILGFDRNSEVVATCTRLSEKLKCRGLEFRTGEISEQKIEGPVHLAVSLHACDTATDDALAQAVALQAAVILAVPCCQHELAREIKAPDMAPLQQHGILHEQFASLATDALRAQALEACGYKTQVVEFIDLEHTAKNLLIRAVRRPNNRRRQEAKDSYDQFKKSLGLGPIATDRIVEQLDQIQSVVKHFRRSQNRIPI